jgi:hypothetical protein
MGGGGLRLAVKTFSLRNGCAGRRLRRALYSGHDTDDSRRTTLQMMPASSHGSTGFSSFREKGASGRRRICPSANPLTTMTGNVARLPVDLFQRPDATLSKHP